jgi:hypothetical protein
MVPIEILDEAAEMAARVAEQRHLLLHGRRENRKLSCEPECEHDPASCLNLSKPVISGLSPLAHRLLATSQALLSAFARKARTVDMAKHVSTAG